jgi:hypothetical protein
MDQIKLDMAIVGGPQSPESEVLSKATYTEAWTQRPEFKARYDALSNSAYVNALEANAEVTVTNKQALIDALNGGSMSRGDVLRNIVESAAVGNKFFNRAFRSDAVLRLSAARSGRGWIPELARYTERRSEQFPAHDLWLPLLAGVSPKVRIIILATKRHKKHKI